MSMCWLTWNHIVSLNWSWSEWCRTIDISSFHEKAFSDQLVVTESENDVWNLVMFLHSQQLRGTFRGVDTQEGIRTTCERRKCHRTCPQRLFAWRKPRARSEHSTSSWKAQVVNEELTLPSPKTDTPDSVRSYDPLPSTVQGLLDDDLVALSISSFDTMRYVLEAPLWISVRVFLIPDDSLYMRTTGPSALFLSHEERWKVKIPSPSWRSSVRYYYRLLIGFESDTSWKYFNPAV